VSQSPAPGSVRVDIYDQSYNLRGSDADYILKLAEYVDTKMRTLAQQTQTVDSLRLAVLAALNIADEFHVLQKKYEGVSGEYQKRSDHLFTALDEALNDDGRRAG
jgi:cell division protein ZapA